MLQRTPNDNDKRCVSWGFSANKSPVQPEKGKKTLVRKNQSRRRENTTRFKSKGVEILEAECCPDHIHMLVTIPPHLSVSENMGYLKSKSSLMICDRHANLKYKYGNRHFWCRGYYVDTVGKYETAIRQYIKNQLQEDISNDRISMKELFAVRKTLWIIQIG